MDTWTEHLFHPEFGDPCARISLQVRDRLDWRREFAGSRLIQVQAGVSSGVRQNRRNMAESYRCTEVKKEGSGLNITVDISPGENIRVEIERETDAATVEIVED